MRFFCESLRIHLKNTLRPSMVAVMIMLAAGLLLLGQVFRENIAIQIGLFVESPGGAVLAENGPVERLIERPIEPLLERLIGYGGENWRVIVFESEDELRQAVRVRRIEAGYVFGGGVMFGEAVRVYTSTATVADRISNLMVAAVLLEAEMGEIGAGVLAPIFPDVPAEILASNIQARAEGYLAGGLLMERTIIEHASVLAEAGLPESGTGFGLAGAVMAVLIPFVSVLIALFGLLQYRPPHIRKTVCTAAAVCAAVLAGGAFGAAVSCLFVIGMIM